ncbi:MAG: hypothetical protein U0326_06500 [Polyangiales bacterium]
MANLFEKRATEYLRDNDSFLSLITPEPLSMFLKEPAQEERLYDRLAIIVGTPGSGKTTMATLLQFHFVDSLRRNQNRTGYKELLLALTECRAVDEDGQPIVAGVRLPLEAEYRDFWELPYPTAIRTRLVLALIQARAMLGWLRNIEMTGQYGPGRVRLIARAGVEAAAAEIGGLDIDSARKRAVEVERAVYSIGAALVPPAREADFPESARSAYRPFDVLESIELHDANGPLRLRPLVMLDDAHTLHPEQLAAIKRDLARRELRIARWVLTRLDVLSPREALLSESGASDETGLQLGRDITEIAMQKGMERNAQRRAFRRMAQDMANRYLRQMPEFAQRGHDKLADLLETEPERLSESAQKKLEKEVEREAKALGISAARRKALEAEINRYLAGTPIPDTGADVRLAMLLILFHRFVKRVPQASLFELSDADPTKPLKADAGVAEAARVHLHHKFGRALYFGINTVCDSGSENAEQFLRLAGRLVARSETKLVRNRSAVLDSSLQHSELVAEAKRILEMDFPYAHEVRALVSGMAQQCLQRSLEPNASLGGGACAFGVPQEQFDAIPRAYPRLARVLQFAVAYNVVTLAQNYSQGDKNEKKWCLIELGGCVLLTHGLTLKRGGFLERTTKVLADLLPEEA